MKKIVTTIFIMIALIGCKKESQKGRTPLAKVGSIIITEEELKSQLPEIASQFMGEEERAQMLDLSIKATVFYLAAKDEGLLEDPQIQDKIRWMERLLIADEYFKRKVERDINVTEKEIEDFYEKYKNEFQKEIDIAYVMGRKKKDVEEARKMMKRMSAVKAITEFQKNPNLSADIYKGVNLGGLRMYLGLLPKELIDAIFSLKVGEISEVIEIPPDQYGFIRILDETKASVTKDQVMEEIKSFLFLQKAQQKRDSLFNALKERYKVEIFKK